jgi:hypothetical protein
VSGQEARATARKVEYTVRWEIQLWASSPEEAAAVAREIQLDPDSLATVFRCHPSKPTRGRVQTVVDVAADGGARDITVRVPRFDGSTCLVHDNAARAREVQP